jgi:hypothetical protein
MSSAGSSFHAELARRDSVDKSAARNVARRTMIVEREETMSTAGGSAGAVESRAGFVVVSVLSGVDRQRGDSSVRSEQQPCLECEGALVVQCLRPPMANDELGAKRPG